MESGIRDGIVAVLLLFGMLVVFLLIRQEKKQAGPTRRDSIKAHRARADLYATAARSARNAGLQNMYEKLAAAENSEADRLEQMLR